MAGPMSSPLIGTESAINARFPGHREERMESSLRTAVDKRMHLPLFSTTGAITPSPDWGNAAL